MKPFILSSVCAYSLLLSATYVIGGEEPTTTKSITSPESIVNYLDKAIREKTLPPANNILSTFSLIANALLSTNLFTVVDTALNDILHTINTSPYPQSLNSKIIDALRKKNAYFNTFVNRYTEIACQDIEEVTSATLFLIEDPTQDQPSKKLNALPIELKRYVMRKAQEDIDFYCPYTILEMPAIYDHVIHGKNYLAALQIDLKSVALWCLKSGKQLCTLSSDQNYLVKSFTFNKSGSRLSIAINNNENDESASHKESIIQEWNTESLEKTFTIPMSNILLHSIRYIENEQSTIIAGLGQSKNYQKHTQYMMWQVQPNGRDTTYLGSSNLCGFDSNPMIDFCPHANPTNGFHITNLLTCTISRSAAAVYLCTEAIKKINNTTEFSTIKKSQTYAKLTEFEENMIDQQMQEREATLKQLQQRNDQKTPLLLTNNICTDQQ